MTTFKDKFQDGAKVAAGVRLVFAAKQLRNAATNDAIITPGPITVAVNPLTGEFTTPDLDPGVYSVRVQWSGSQPSEYYDVDVPTTGTNIRLWPKIAEYVQLPPDTPMELLAKYFAANPVQGGGGGLDQTAVDQRVQTVGDTRYAPQYPHLHPTAPTEAAIRAAVTALSAYGGGTVMLPAAEIALTSPLPAVAGVPYDGVTPVVVQDNVTNQTWMGDGEFTFVGGTRFKGNGTFAAFEANAVDQASVQTDIGNTQISNWGVKNVGVDGFTYGLRVGARNIIGMIHGEIDGFYAKNCTQWGIHLVNWQHISVGKVFTSGCQNGQYYGVQLPGLTLYPGNSTFRELFNLIPRDGRDNRKCRGIVFEATGVNAALNELLADHVQVNGFNRALLSVTATFTNGSTSIAVPDGTQFAAGMMVRFTTTNYGFTLGQIYVVQSVSGNTITLGGSKSSAAVAATGAGTLTLETRGMANIELIGVTNSRFLQLDSEGTASVGVYEENTTGNYVDLADIPATAFVHLVGRSARWTLHHSMNAAVTDFDANSTTSEYRGARNNAYQRPLRGSWLDNISGSNVLALGGGSNNQGTLGDIHVRQAGMLYPKAGMGVQVYPRDSALTLGGQNTGQVVFNGTSATTFTLPTIVTDTGTVVGGSHVGAYFEIANVGTANLTVVTDGTQLVNKLTGKTSIVITPGNSARLAAVRDNAGTLFWLTKAAPLTAAVDRQAPIRPGDWTVILGDSTSVNDATDAPINTATTRRYRNAWPVFAAIMSNQRLRIAKLAGIWGNTTQQMIDRFAADVAAYNPSTVVILTGRNDTTVDATLTGVATLVSRVRDIDAVPVICIPLPTTVAADKQRMASTATKLRAWAVANRVQVIDFHAAMTATNGDLKAAYDDGDGKHPNLAGVKLMGEIAAQALTTVLPAPPRLTAISNNDADNLVVNPLFESIDANFTVAGWSRGSTPSWATYSTVDVDGWAGKALQIVTTATAETGAAAQIRQNIAVGASLAVGDAVEFTGKVKVVSSTLPKTNPILVRLMFEGTSDVVAALETSAVIDGTFHIRAVVPAGTTSIRIQFVGPLDAAGATTVQFGEVALRNVTKLALA